MIARQRSVAQAIVPWDTSFPEIFDGSFPDTSVQVFAGILVSEAKVARRGPAMVIAVVLRLNTEDFPFKTCISGLFCVSEGQEQLL